MWGDACSGLLMSILRLQKKAMRIITHSHRLEHTAPLFKKLFVLRIEEIFFYNTALAMFKVYHNIYPAVFCTMFKRNADIHHYGTRQATQFHVPIARTNYKLNAITVKGVRVWNMLFEKVNHDCSYLSFKIALKKYIFNNPNAITYLS